MCMVRIEVLSVYSLSVKSALIKSSPSAAFPVDLNDPNVILEEISQINIMRKKKKKKTTTHNREHQGFTWFSLWPTSTGGDKEEVSLTNMESTKVV